MYWAPLRESSYYENNIEIDCAVHCAVVVVVAKAADAADSAADIVEILVVRKHRKVPFVRQSRMQDMMAMPMTMEASLSLHSQQDNIHNIVTDAADAGYIVDNNYSQCYYDPYLLMMI